MASSIARLLNTTKLKDIAEIADQISNHCDEINEALCDYEGADDAEPGERADIRSEARDACYAAMGDLVTEAEKMKREYETLMDRLS